MLLLQILDEGFLTDSQGRKVDFRNTILIGTSNLGADALYEPSAIDGSTGLVSASAKAAVMRQVQAFFPPELLNRIDDQLIFNRLSEQSLRGIVDIRLREIEERLRERRVSIDVSDEAKQWLAEKGYDPAYGARPLNRLLQRKILNPLASALIRGTVRAGDKVPVVLDGENDEVEIRELHPEEEEEGERERRERERDGKDGAVKTQEKEQKEKEEKERLRKQDEQKANEAVWEGLPADI